jgi:hypothetical protein
MRLMKSSLCLIAFLAAPAFAAVSSATPVKSCDQLIDMSISNMNSTDRQQLISTCKSEKWKLVIGQAAPVKTTPEIQQTAEAEIEDTAGR